MGKGLAILIFLALALPLSMAIGVEITNPLTAKDFRELIENIITFIFNMALIVFPLIMIFAGVLFMTAGGDPKQVERAKDLIFYAFIGFIIILLAKGVITLLEQTLKN
jgi:heme/copper-type cytochrome/quinol oxidase subunit 2